MARQFVAIALILFAVVGFACAAVPAAESPKGSSNKTDVGTNLAPGAADAIGNTDGAAAPGAGNDVVEGPVGEPGAEGATGSAPAESPKSGASTVKFSAVGTVAAVVGFFFF